MTLRTTFGPSPLVNVRAPSSRPILTSASKAWLYPNLEAGALASSAHILTKATWTLVSKRSPGMRSTHLSRISYKACHATSQCRASDFPGAGQFRQTVSLPHFMRKIVV